MQSSLKLVVYISSLFAAGALVSESVMLRRLAQSRRPGMLTPMTRVRHQHFYKAAPNAENEGVVAFRAAVDSLCAPVCIYLLMRDARPMFNLPY